MSFPDFCLPSTYRITPFSAAVWKPSFFRPHLVVSRNPPPFPEAPACQVQQRSVPEGGGSHFFIDTHFCIEIDVFLGGIIFGLVGSLGSSILPLVGIAWVDFIYFKCKKLAGSVEGFPNVRLSSLAGFNVLCLNSGMPPKHFAIPIGSMGMVRIIIYIYHKKSTIHVGKYTSPMDPMGILDRKKWESLLTWYPSCILIVTQSPAIDCWNFCISWTKFIGANCRLITYLKLETDNLATVKKSKKSLEIHFPVLIRICFQPDICKNVSCNILKRRYCPTKNGRKPHPRPLTLPHRCVQWTSGQLWWHPVGVWVSWLDVGCHESDITILVGLFACYTFVSNMLILDMYLLLSASI